MMFGRASAPNEPAKPSIMEAFEDTLRGRTSLNSMGSGSSYDEYKEAAGRVAGQLYEKGSNLKAATMDWFSQFSQPGMQ